jgi:hypothetical protein
MQEQIHRAPEHMSSGKLLAFDVELAPEHEKTRCLSNQGSSGEG